MRTALLLFVVAEKDVPRAGMIDLLAELHAAERGMQRYVNDARDVAGQIEQHPLAAIGGNMNRQIATPQIGGAEQP